MKRSLKLLKKSLRNIKKRIPGYTKAKKMIDSLRKKIEKKFPFKWISRTNKWKKVKKCKYPKKMCPLVKRQSSLWKQMKNLEKKNKKWTAALK
jgi:hypothetical protein